MDSRLGFMFGLSFLFLRINLSFSSIDIKGLLPLKCRIAGVVLVEQKFNYTMAENVCKALGLQLASKANVAKARDFDFETCSYGWVTEKYGVIPRIRNNEKCGRNLTGVLEWKVQPTHLFNVYCFNSSDVRINSCKPELMATTAASAALPTTDSPTPPTTQTPTPEERQGRTTASQIPPSTSRESTSRPLLSTLITTLKMTSKEAPPTTTLTSKEAPPTTTLRMTTLPLTEEPTNPPERQPARHIERIVFGKLPTALLILAIVFFIAAVVLAICYIKKYKTSVFFSKIKEEKESVEAKVLRDTTNADNSKEEVTPNGREENPQNLEAYTGNSMEAEV